MTHTQILVVEDDRIVAEEIRTILEHLNYTVSDIVYSGEHAIQKAAESPNVILMDIELQGTLDGIEAANRIRSQFDIPIIYLTAYSDEETLQRTKLTEPFGYITKPFEGKALRIAIEMALYKHRMEKKLRESEEKFKTIGMSAKDAIIMMDHNGNISFWNRAAAQMFGYAPEEVLEKKLHSLLSPPSADEVFQKAFSTFQTTGKGMYVDQTCELRATRKDGTEFPLELSLSAFKLQGKWNAVGIVRDITKRKQIEEQLQKLTQQLSEASTHKSNFLSSMSHELRTPLNAMIGYTSLTLNALKDTLPPEHLQNLTRAEHSARILLQLINDVLDFSKIEAGRLETFIEEIDLTDVLEDVVMRAEGLLAGKSLELIVDYPPDLPAIESDYTRLKQILDNLMSNAIKFTTEGHVALRASHQHEQDRIRVEVEDTGCGISEENVKGIFNLFQQVDGSITKKFGGTGLGLALTQKLSAMLGLDVGVHGELNKGTTFWLDIPRTFRQETPTLRQPAIHTKSSFGSTSLEPLVAQPQHDQPKFLHDVPPSLSEIEPVTATPQQVGHTVPKVTADTSVVVLCYCQKQPMCSVVSRHLTGVPIEIRPVTTPAECIEHDKQVDIWAILVEDDAKGNKFVKELHAEPALQHIPIVLSSTDDFTRGGERFVQAITLAETPSILVVDDNEMNLDVITRVFEATGYIVYKARSGQTGIELARTYVPDVILMDLAMPDMDGFDATRILKQDPDTVDITVIACSAFATRQYKEKAFDVGCDGYITKPVEPTRLVEQVAKIMLTSNIRKKRGQAVG